MALKNVLILLITVFTLCLLVLINADLSLSSISEDFISDSKFENLSRLELGLFRLIFSLVIWGSIFYIYVDKEGIEFNVLLTNGSTKALQLKHLDRFIFFTVWSWVIQGIYFVLATLYSFSDLISIPLVTNTLKSPYFTGTTVVLFELAFPIAYIVSLVANFVLIPAANKNNLPIKHMFKIPPLLMHNANIIFMAFEIIVNKISFNLLHFPFILLFGLIYAAFTFVLYKKRRVFYYFFLDFNRDYAVFWYLALLVGVAVFFVGGWAYSFWITAYSGHYLPYVVMIALTAVSLKFTNNK